MSKTSDDIFYQLHLEYISDRNNFYDNRNDYVKELLKSENILYYIEPSKTQTGKYCYATKVIVNKQKLLYNNIGYPSKDTALMAIIYAYRYNVFIL